MITLSNETLTLGISENLGASVLFCRYQDQDILRPAPQNITHAKQSSLFVMLPYCGDISDGKFTYFGITRQILPASSETPTLNGDGWVNSWQIVKNAPQEATLLYTHDKSKGGFPFNYQARITYALRKNQLLVTLSIKNPSKLPLPCGMGICPCFSCKSQAKLYFNASHIWHHKSTPIFDRPYETPKEWKFQNGKAITDDFDTCFGGWNGLADIKYPDGLKIHIDAPDIFHHLTLNSQTHSEDSFYLAPVSNTPDAFNLAAQGVINTGIQSIGPDQTLTKTITLTIESEK